MKTSGRALPPADVAILSGYSSFGYGVSFTWFLWLALYASTSALACDSVPARVHIVIVVPSSAGPSPSASAPPLSQAAVAVIATAATAATSNLRRRVGDAAALMLVCSIRIVNQLPVRP